VPISIAEQQWESRETAMLLLMFEAERAGDSWRWMERASIQDQASVMVG
jgi:hypothetical protein